MKLTVGVYASKNWHGEPEYSILIGAKHPVDWYTGHVFITTSVVEFDELAHDKWVMAYVEMLIAQKQATRADAEKKCTDIEAEIQKMLALEDCSTVVDVEPGFAPRTPNPYADDDIPF